MSSLLRTALSARPSTNVTAQGSTGATNASTRRNTIVGLHGNDWLGLLVGTGKATRLATRKATP